MFLIYRVTDVGINKKVSHYIQPASYMSIFCAIATSTGIATCACADRKSMQMADSNKNRCVFIMMY